MVVHFDAASFHCAGVHVLQVLDAFQLKGEEKKLQVSSRNPMNSVDKGATAMRAATKCGFSAWWHWLTCSRTILRVHVWCDTGIGQEHEGEARSSAQQQEANQVGSSIGFGENAMHTHARARVQRYSRGPAHTHDRPATESMSASASASVAASAHVY